MSLQEPTSTFRHNQTATYAVSYANESHAAALMRQTRHVLGMIGFGLQRPASLPASCPFVGAPLVPATGAANLEIWTATSPVRHMQLGAVSGACSDDVAFGVIEFDELRHVALEAAVEDAYGAIFDFLDQCGFSVPIRFWNYLNAITGDDDGLERYMRFNTGRHRAFAARLQQAVPPVASCVGGNAGASIIYFLAAREPARPIENPRQVSAYDYPPLYGPSSPKFSRASIHTLEAASTLFISGTASIVGHETRHAGDLAGQVAETVENLRALLGAANLTGDAALAHDWAVKIYLQEGVDRAAVDPALRAVFGVDSQRLYLRGEICRTDLLLEVEAFCNLASRPAS